MKRVMVVAGGEWQVPLIHRIKSEGHYVVNTNLYKNSPGFAFADESYVADVLDKQANLDIARQSRIDAVVTDQSDIAVPTVAFIAEALGLPGIGPGMATLFTNKYEMRRFCKDKGFPAPRFALCGAPENAEDFVGQYGPSVLKPPDNQSSRGVHVLQSGFGVEALFADALAACKSGVPLIEEYLEGYELTVEGYQAGGRHVTLAISEKVAMPDYPQIASTLWYSRNALHKHAKLIEIHDALMEATGLPFGITHAEYKCHNGRYTLIEVAARGGGTKIASHIVPAVSGADVYACLIADAMGAPRPPITRQAPRCAVALDFFRFAPGEVHSISGMGALLRHPNVIDAGLNFSVGDEVPPLKDDRSRAGHLIAHAENDGALRSLLPELKSKVIVAYA